MPSGYTARIYEGELVTFPEFAMTCARAFGALINLKEEPFDAPIPSEITPSPYYAERLERARERLAEAEGWTDEDAEARAASDHAGAVREIEKSNAVARGRRERYEAMRAQAQAWQAPTPDHQGLKDFMIEQLSDSARFDCHETGIPEPVPGPEYRRRSIEERQAEVGRAGKAHAEEVERANGRTEWVRALRASLAAPLPAATAEASDG